MEQEGISMQQSDKHHFVLFAKYGHNYLELGHKVDTNFGYVGPQVFFKGIWYHFSGPVLELLDSRFKAINGPQNVMLITRFDLLGMMDDDPVNAVFEVGGDRSFDPPFDKYLPEMYEDEDFREKLIRIRRTKSLIGIGGQFDSKTEKWLPPDPIPDGWRYNPNKGLWEEDF